jgi:hypothetical protein
MRIYISALVVLLITLFAHISGMNGLYMSIPAYDVFMHILGGAGIGLALSAVVRSDLSHIRGKRSKIILGVLLAGTLWELFEMYFNIAGAPVGTKAYLLDTVKDLIDDTIGGALMAWLCLRNRK